MPDRRPNTPWGGETRAKDGVTVYFENASGDQQVVVRSGAPPTVLLREAIALAERWEGEWKIRVISTPTTIYRDLQGSRRPLALAGNEDHVRRRPVAHNDFRPERQMLALIGRRDLLASP